MGNSTAKKIYWESIEWAACECRELGIAHKITKFFNCPKELGIVPDRIFPLTFLKTRLMQAMRPEQVARN